MTRHTRGFTLVELVTVVAVMGVLAAIAFPGMRNYMDKQRLVSQVRAISELAQLARGEAIKHSSSAALNISKTVSMTINPGTPWSVGLSNGTAACSTIANCVINQAGTDVGYRLTATECSTCTMSSPAAQAVITFDTRGLVMTTGAADELVTLNSPLGKNLSLSVNRLGRISLCTTGNSVGGYPAC